jgi:hypothetical protein
MIYIVRNLVQKPQEPLPYWATTKVFAVDDEMARAVSRAVCSMEGYKTIDQQIKERR